MLKYKLSLLFNKPFALSQLQKYLLLLIFFYGHLISFAQDGFTEEEIKTSYLIKFLQEINWETFNSNKTINIGIASDDKTFNNLKDKSTYLSIKNRVLSIKKVTKLENDLDLIYYGKNSTPSTTEIENSINCLTVFDEEARLENSMIVFYKDEENIKFQMDLNEMEKHRLTPSVELLIYSGYKKEALEAYEKAQKQLNKEKEIVAKQLKQLKSKEKTILDLSNQIELKEKTNNLLLFSIGEKQKLVKERTAELEELATILNKKHNELKVAEDNLEKIRELNSEMIHQLNDYQSSLENIKEEVIANKSILSKQKKKINDQQNTLNQKEQQLEISSGIITVVSIFSVFSLLLLYIIYRENKAKNNTLKIIEEQNVKIKEASSHKDQFIANLSHEVRTPLNAIVGYTSLLKSKSRNQEQNEILEHISLSSNNLLGIINDILDLSKIEAGKIEVENIPFNINQVINNAFNSLEINALEKGLNYSLNTIENFSDHCIGDPTKLGQVLLNLLSNSIKFTSEGNVNLTTKIINQTDDKVKVKFIVDDTGIGISPDKQNKIFESFTQEDASTTRKFGGTGLGLTISQKLVEAMGGKIEIESEVNKGSRFLFELEFPIEGDAHENIDSEFKYKIEGINQLSIIYADDNPINCKLMDALFKDSGKENGITIASNGRELISLVSNNNYDVILTDIRMPKVSGVEATRKIRANGHKGLIIGISANSSSVLIKEAIEAGMDHYFTKPIDFNALIKSIADYFNLTIKTELNHTNNDTILFERIRVFTKTEEAFEEEKNKLIADISSIIDEMQVNEISYAQAHRLFNLMVYVGHEKLMDLTKSLDKSLLSDDLTTSLQLLTEIKSSWSKFITDQN